MYNFSSLINFDPELKNYKDRDKAVANTNIYRIKLIECTEFARNIFKFSITRNNEK